MNKERLTIKGELDITMLDEHGKVVKHEHLKNLVHNAGFDGIAAQVFGTPSTAFHHMAAGASADSLDATDTTLQGSELSRVLAVYAHTVGTKIITLTGTFAAGVATGTWEEVGLFDADPNGNMLSRALTGTWVKAATYSIVNVWTITLS
jgi:hypothetical protein